MKLCRTKSINNLSKIIDDENIKTYKNYNAKTFNGIYTINI